MAQIPLQTNWLIQIGFSQLLTVLLCLRKLPRNATNSTTLTPWTEQNWNWTNYQNSTEINCTQLNCKELKWKLSLYCCEVLSLSWMLVISFFWHILSNLFFIHHFFFPFYKLKLPSLLRILRCVCIPSRMIKGLIPARRIKGMSSIPQTQVLGYDPLPERPRCWINIPLHDSSWFILYFHFSLHWE